MSVSSRIFQFMRHNALGLVAIFIALGGTAVAATQAPRNSVVTKSIQKGAVTNPKLKDGAVTGAKVLDGSIAVGDLADGSVNAAKLADGSVNSAKLADGGVGAADLADGSVNSATVANGSLTAADLAPGTVGKGTTIQGGFAPTIPAGQSVVYPIGQTSLNQGSAVAPVTMTLSDLQVVTSAPPGVGEALTLTLFVAPPGNPAGAAPTAVSCSVIGPGQTCSSNGKATVVAGSAYTFFASRGATSNGVNFGYTTKPE
jgi:hypothetical protein